MQYQSPYRRPRKKKGKVILVLVIVVVMLATVAAAIALAGRIGGGGIRSAAGSAYRAEGSMAALRLAAPTGEMTTDALSAYFDEAVAAAKAQNLNTLIFEGRQGLSVLWEDGTFPMLAEADTAGADPLALLCDAAKGQDVQVYVAMDPYASGKYTSETKGNAADYARRKNDPVRFETDDADYQKLLLNSLGDLTKYYPVAGVVLTDLKEDMAGDTNFAAALTGIQDAIGETALALDTAAAGESSATDWAALVDSGEANFVIAAVAEGGQIGQRLADYGDTAGSLVLDESGDASGAVLFTASREEVFGGAVYGSWPGADAARTGFLRSTLAEAEGQLPAGFDIPRTLQVNYPLESDTIAADQAVVYVMGNSDPDLPLLLDGKEVPRTTADGSFGIACTLPDEENILTFTQGDKTLTHTISRPNPPATSGGDGGGDGDGGEPILQNDNTTEAEIGQAVQVKGVFAGGLTDPNDDGIINETFYGGAVGVVRDNFETWRYDVDAGKTLKTWAYQLTSGDWVLARNCALIDGDGASAFTGLSAAMDDKGEWITLEGTGTPAALISYEGNTLSLTMYDTSFILPGGFTSTYVKSASVEEVEGGGIRLDLVVEGIWGYQIDYTEGTRLFLKSPPTLSDNPAQPLAGIRVMLDAGHGDTDMGAPGIMGSKQQPNEKDVNLAQAQAIAYRLRQLGAEVVMVREGETFYTVSERLAMEIEAKPDFFLSVHHNSANLNMDMTDVTGAQVYYHIPKGYSAPVSYQYGQNLMDAVAAATGRKASDSAYNYFTVNRTPVCPSVLFEYGFMVNPGDFSDITSAEGLYAAACGTAEGIYNTVADITLASPPAAGDGSASGGEAGTPVSGTESE